MGTTWIRSGASFSSCTAFASTLRETAITWLPYTLKARTERCIGWMACSVETSTAGVRRVAKKATQLAAREWAWTTWMLRSTIRRRSAKMFLSRWG